MSLFEWLKSLPDVLATLISMVICGLAAFLVLIFVLAIFIPWRDH